MLRTHTTPVASRRLRLRSLPARSGYAIPWPTLTWSSPWYGYSCLRLVVHSSSHLRIHSILICFVCSLPAHPLTGLDSEYYVFFILRPAYQAYSLFAVTLLKRLRWRFRACQVQASNLLAARFRAINEPVNRSSESFLRLSLSSLRKSPPSRILLPLRALSGQRPFRLRRQCVSGASKGAIAP